MPAFISAIINKVEMFFASVINNELHDHQQQHPRQPTISFDLISSYQAGIVAKAVVVDREVRFIVYYIIYIYIYILLKLT